MSIPEGRVLHGPEDEGAIAMDLMLYGDAYCTEAPEGAGVLLPLLAAVIQQPLPSDAAAVIGGMESQFNEGGE